MSNFRKYYKKTISIAIIVSFLFTNSLYSFPVSERTFLRVPVGKLRTYERIAVSNEAVFKPDRIPIDAWTGSIVPEFIDSWRGERSPIPESYVYGRKNILGELLKQVPFNEFLKDILTNIDYMTPLNRDNLKGACYRWACAVKYILKDLPYIEEVKLMRTKDDMHSWIAVKFVGHPELYAFDRTIGNLDKYSGKVNRLGLYCTLGEAQKIAGYFSEEKSIELTFDDPEKIIDGITMQPNERSVLRQQREGALKAYIEPLIPDFFSKARSEEEENFRKMFFIEKDTILFNGGTNTELFKRTCSKIKPELLNLFVAANKKEMGLIFAIMIIRGIRHFQKKLDPRDMIPVIFCTGNTPWVGYMYFEIIIKNWDNHYVQNMLKMYGIDPSVKPDMKRILAYPMDATFPQKRIDPYAFSNILNNMFDRVGILKKNRRFFYGDLIMEKDYRGYRKMNPREYQELMADIKKNNGLLIDYPDSETGQIKILAERGSIQHRHMTAVLKHALKLDNELRQLGGAMVVNSGLGADDFEDKLGDGHVAFNDGETRGAFSGPAYIAPACPFVRFGHGGEDKDGIKGTFIEQDGKINPTFGIVTFSMASLFYRSKDNDPTNNAIVNVIGEGGKFNTLHQMVQGKNDIKKPATLLPRDKCTINAITETFCASSGLTLYEHPYWFKKFREWSDDDIKTFFIRLALLRGKRINELQEKDFLDFKENEPNNDDIKEIKKYNLATLLEKDDWEELKERVIKELSGMIAKPEDMAKRGSPLNEKLGLNEKDGRIVFILPHLDDGFLAMPNLIKALCDAGYELVLYFLAKGHHAVDNEYLLNHLRHMAKWNAKELERFTRLDDDSFAREEEELIKELITLCSNKTHVQDRNDYDPWSHMEEKEKDVRARLLFLRLNKMLDGSLSTPERVGAFRNFFIKAVENEPRNGSKSLKLMEDMKTIVRFHEELTASVSLGVKYANIHYPEDVSWYGSAQREGTASEEDIEIGEKILMQEIKKEGSPIRLVVSNFEDFSDHGSHMLTQITTAISMLKIKTKEFLKGVKLLGIAGVWERIKYETAEIAMPLSQEQMDELFFKFMNFYPSQNPPSGAAQNFREIKFFPEMVSLNLGESARIAKAILGEDSIGAPFLAHFNIIDLEEEKERREIKERIHELGTSRDILNMASFESINGVLLLADLTRMRDAIQQLGDSGISLYRVVTKKEFAGQLEKAKQPIYRKQAAYILEMIKMSRRRDDLLCAHHLLRFAKDALGEGTYGTLPRPYVVVWSCFEIWKTKYNNGLAILKDIKKAKNKEEVLNIAIEILSGIKRFGDIELEYFSEGDALYFSCKTERAGLFYGKVDEKLNLSLIDQGDLLQTKFFSERLMLKGAHPGEALDLRRKLRKESMKDAHQKDTSL